MYSKMMNFISNRIGVRIVVSFCALVLILVGGGGWSLYRLAVNQFERQMADHLVSVSLLVAEGLDGDVVGQIHPEYGLYRRLLARIRKQRDRVGAARIVVFGQKGTRLLDTATENAFGLPYARFAFDQQEIERAWNGMATHSVAFYDESGMPFQTGYAPLFRGETVVALVAVDLGVGFVGAVEAFRQSLYLLGMVGVFLTVVVGFVLSKTLTRPIGQLVRWAQLIGKGNLDEPVVMSSQDELGELGKTLDVMRQQLAARDEQLRQMLGGVAHEIRNPLGGIELYAGFIADDLAVDDARREHILKVIAEVRNLNQVISDFLSFARPATFEMARIALSQVISDALFLLAPEMENASVEVVCDLDEGRDIWADEMQLKGALVNIFKNALQAMPQGGTLEIRMVHTNDRVRLTVTDTGKGISGEDLTHIFDPFFTTKEQGSGLGLSIVRQILERHQAELNIDSKLGVGTTVEMVFERDA